MPGKRRWRRTFVMSFVLLVGFTVVPVAGAVTVMNTGVQVWGALPGELDTSDVLPQRSTILAADGTVIATFFAENRVPLEWDEIPQSVKDAVLATEDARFFEHHGVDWLGTVRAVVNNMRGLPQQGGSGITQQYVKNLLITNADTEDDVAVAQANTLERKLREARYALTLEQSLSKEDIFAGYLNTVYFGDGAYGIGAAAQHYFNVTVDQLTLGQAALLAGIINNLVRFDPTRDLDAAVKRREHVLDRMVTVGLVTRAEADAAATEPVELDLVTPANGCVASAFPLYCQWIRETLASDPVFGATSEQRQEFLYRGGLTVRTALDPAIEEVVLAAAKEALPAGGRVATAVAVVEPGTGLVKALGTNKPFGQKRGQTELLLPVLEKFQNGSTFKPLTAATAIEMGTNPDIVISAGPTYTPADRNAPDGGFTNAGDSHGGTMNMTDALKHSVNTWFVELEDRIGVRNIAKTASAMGLTSLPITGENAITEKDAALTLGAWDTSPLQVANSYATLAAHGIACNPIGITSITNATGTRIPVPTADCKQVIRTSTADTVTGMLTTVITPDGTGYRAELPGDRPAAGKTGSTNDYGAAWFAGYTPQYATAVWVGDPRGPQYGMRSGVTAYGNQTYAPVYGGTIPALIWKDVMSGIHDGLPVRQFAPAGGTAVLGQPVVMPDVRGTTPEVAARLLRDAGFTVGEALDDGPAMDAYPTGTVTDTTPAAGVRLTNPNRVVTLHTNGVAVTDAGTTG